MKFALSYTSDVYYMNVMYRNPWLYGEVISVQKLSKYKHYYPGTLSFFLSHNNREWYPIFKCCDLTH